MADTIQFNADVNPAIREIDKLTKKVEDFGNKFQSKLEAINGYAAGLGATLAGLGAVVASFADEIADIATANELAVSQVLAFSKALEQNGGKASATGQILQRFSSNIESANSGNLKMVSTLGRLGLGIEELGTLSNTELKDKLLRNLAGIKDPMERNALATEVFGKAILGVDLTKFAGDQEALTREMAPYAASLQDAADAWDNLTAIFGKIKLAFAEAFNPIFKFLKDAKIEVDTLVIGFRLLGAALLVMTAAGVIAGLAKIVTLMRTLTLVVSKNPLVAIAGALVSLGVGAATYLGLGKSIEEKEKDIEEAIKKEGEAKKNVKRNQDGLNDALKKEQGILTQIGEQLDRNWKKALAKYKTELDSIGQSEQEKRLIEEKSKIEQEAQDAIFQLKQKYDALDTAAKARNKTALDEEIKAIEKNAAKQKESADSALIAIEARKAAIYDLTRSFNVWTSKTGEILQAEGKLATAVEGNAGNRIKIEAQLNEVMARRQAITEQMSKLSIEDQLKINQAINNATLSTSDQIGKTNDLGQAFDDAFRTQIRGMNMSKEGFKAVTENIAATGNAISESTEIFIDSQEKIYNTSRTFEYGWTNAFNQYVSDATNAAMKAQKIFQTLSQSLEDSLFRFFTTGKFGWKQFADDIIKEMIRIETKQLAMNILTGGSGKVGKSGSGLLGLGGLFGFLANGGPANANKPYIVGERGPELFVPNSTGTVVPNGAFGGGGNVTYNINAVDAMSFKQMIAADPTFLHAVAEQGRRRLPGAR